MLLVFGLTHMRPGPSIFTRRTFQPLMWLMCLQATPELSAKFTSMRPATLNRQLRHLLRSLCARTLPNKSLIELHRSTKMRRNKKKKNEKKKWWMWRDESKRVKREKKNISSEINWIGLKNTQFRFFHHRIMEMNLLCRHRRHQCHCVWLFPLSNTFRLSPMPLMNWNEWRKTVSRTL